jgi:hypothetical protein
MIYGAAYRVLLGLCLAMCTNCCAAVKAWFFGAPPYDSFSIFITTASL